ncbi:unnamed protein product, partial [Polarella glacialis]
MGPCKMPRSRLLSVAVGVAVWLSSRELFAGVFVPSPVRGANTFASERFEEIGRGNSLVARRFFDFKFGEEEKPKEPPVVIKEDYRLAAFFAVLGALMIATLPYAGFGLGLLILALGILFYVQAGRVRFVFDDDSFELRTVGDEAKEGEELKAPGQNIVVGGANRWAYSSFVNWEFFPKGLVEAGLPPVLVYFKENQTPSNEWSKGPGEKANSEESLAAGAVPGQVHFFPAICDAQQIKAEFERRARAKADKEGPLIETPELRERLAKGEDIILVDVRTPEEMQVSMIPGAVAKDLFEAEILPKLLEGRQQDGQQQAIDSLSSPLIVPYCTVGYRSGLYCRELVNEHGFSNVRNGEGVIMWTFDGSVLVKPLPGAPSRAPALPPQVYGKGSEGAQPSSGEAAGLVSGGGTKTATAWQSVSEVHVYGKPWDMAAEGFTTIYFTPVGGALRFLRQKCQSRAALTAALWTGAFLLFYLLFTPACGVMYDCGCVLALSKWGQVKPCNVFTGPHRCPWCSCSGLACIFVGSDSKAFRGVPLLDLVPDGCFLTVITVLV